MQLVEQHIIKKNDSRFEQIDKASFASKNLYNCANYVLRQDFIFNRRYISYPSLQKQMQKTEEYQTLPAKVAQQVLINLDKNWQSFFAATKEWKENQGKFSRKVSRSANTATAKPRLPKYKDKLSGRNLLLYTHQAISQVLIKQGVIKPSGLEIQVQTKQEKVDCVRIVPKKNHYVVEVVYKVEPKKANVNPSLVASIDIGLNNLATVTSNKPGFVPVVVNGRPLKSINQYYNKKKARLQSLLSSRMPAFGKASSPAVEKRRFITNSRFTGSREAGHNHEGVPDDVCVGLVHVGANF